MKYQNIVVENINKNEALRYLGYKNHDLDETTKELLLHSEKELLKVVKPSYVYKVFELKDNQLIGVNFELQGSSIKKHLEGCEKVVFLCATLSAKVDKLIRQKQITSMTEAVMIDSLASVLIEQVLDEIEKIIMEDFEGYEHTWRFGLGYGDFPIEQQKSFLDILDAPKRISVGVNEGMMLVPAKSVTCVIGIGKGLDNRAKKSCEVCNLRENCQFRKEGINCDK